jgi:transposase
VKTFRACEIEQAWLLPPSILDFVPAEHPAHFIRDLVRESLDLSEIYAVYTEERGYPPYHPAMMRSRPSYTEHVHHLARQRPDR